MAVLVGETVPEAESSMTAALGLSNIRAQQSPVLDLPVHTER